MFRGGLRSACVWLCLGGPPLPIQRGVARKSFGDSDPTLRAGDYDSLYGTPYYGCSYSRAGLVDWVQARTSVTRPLDPRPFLTNTAVLASGLTAYFNTVAARIPFPFTEATKEAADPPGTLYRYFSIKLRQSFLQWLGTIISSVVGLVVLV